MQGDNYINRGFTLVEVVIAMALLLLTLTAFIASFVQSKRSAAIADNRLEAISGARRVMETLLSGIYVFDFPPSSLSDGRHQTNTVLNTVLYTVVTVTQAPGIVVQDIYLTNYWVNPGGKITSTVSLAGSVSATLHQ